MPARVRGFAAPVAVAFVVASMATAVSCGGGGGKTPTATGQPGGGGASGGSGGGGTSGGGAGGGTSTSGGGTGNDGGGTSSGGTSSGGTSGGASGGGSSGSGDACAGLTATLDAGHILRFDTGTHSGCWRATSDPSGQIALGIQGRAFTTEVTFLLYPPDAASQQGSISLLFPNSVTDIDPWFHSTSDGHAGLVHDPPPAVGLRSFDHSGAPLATTSDFAVSSAPDAHGGTVMLGRAFSTGGPTPGVHGPTMLEWLDASGGVLRTVTLDDDPTMLLVDWGTDHVLTLLPGAGGLRARWYDGTGTPLTAWFDAGPPINGVTATMHLLLDGTIALGDGETWRGVFRDGVAAIDPPPGWLAARPRTRLATIRHGRAYAVLPFPGAPATSGADQTTFEIVTASGDSCGRVTIPDPPSEPGVTHDPTALDVGQDGTLFQTEALLGDGAVLGSGIHGDFRWWPALLR